MISLISYNQTPVVELFSHEGEQSGVRLFVKREDMNHPLVSGNKWWKLSMNLDEAVRLNHNTLLTFGGAYSNHLYATAAAAYLSGMKCVGVVRGERISPLNPTLSFVEQHGMHLHFITRESYRKKTEQSFVKELYQRYGSFYLIPEGGSNRLAIESVRQLGKKLIEETDFDFLCTPVGTGGTLAGLVAALNSQKEVIGFSSLKGGAHLVHEVKRLLNDYCNRDFSNWRIESSYHFGGYGKSTKELIGFIREQHAAHDLPLDHVYTGKMMFGIMDMIKRRIFPRGSKILALHTGGLQGTKLSE